MAWLQGHWTPKWDYKVARLVPCPESYCRSNIGWPCTTKSGNVSATCHSSRHAAYWRKKNAQESS